MNDLMVETLKTNKN